MLAKLESRAVDRLFCFLETALSLSTAETAGCAAAGSGGRSSLEEFAHIQSGEIPERDETTRELELTDGMCIVLILIPGGMFTMGAEKPSEERPEGAPNVDPDAQSNANSHEVTLAPFFMSKYEMTQGQWERFTGENPSYYKERTVGGKRIGSLNPVEQVDWLMCDRELRRLGLALPTEAQWEYACRAGTTSVWSTGNDRESLRGKVNLADQAAKRVGASWSAIQDWPDLDDGHAVHAPVGTYEANAWGLHEVHGNVWEWCRDLYGSYSLDVREGSGERKVPVSSARFRVRRGGNFRYAARYGRSAYRYAPTIRYDLGARPSRAISTEY